MRCLDSRRLTGPNLLWQRPGAVLDVELQPQEVAAGIKAWRRQVKRMLAAVGWAEQRTCVRKYDGGASFAVSAPIDALYAATDINDWAFEAAEKVLSGEEEPRITDTAAQFRAVIAEESLSHLVAVRAVAAARSLPVLVDTEFVSVGLGRGSETWPLAELPPAEAISWESKSTIPVGLITGTNGKTTSVRLAAAMARAAGLTAGISSTDWIAVGEDILDEGDYSGPGGARTVLRDARADIAILETARGGMLRRGLAVEHADAALITNVAADHLGEFGVANTDELAAVKWVVTRALPKGGSLILCADDDRLIRRAKKGEFDITWFSAQRQHPQLSAHAAKGGKTVAVQDDRVVFFDGRSRHDLLAVDAIPICLGGAAEHNVTNALGAVGLMAALGLPLKAIEEGLRAMRPQDNPGRSNLYRVNGARVIVDFAHNPHGMQAFLQVARNLPARRRLLVTGQAGDRSDEDIKSLARASCGVELNRVLIKKMAAFNRGRPDGQAARVLHDEFVSCGLAPEALEYCDEELDAVERALAWADRGDLVILLVHAKRNEVLDYLTKVQDPPEQTNL